MTIKANRDYITVILERILAGEYVIPEFQRDFVWSVRQIIELFDSIINGYPIGSLILWKPESESFKTLNNIGGISLSANQSGTDTMYILDGRQRLTALASVLYSNGQFYHQICIDLEEMRIIRVPVNRSNIGVHILKLGVAYDTYELVGFLERLRASSLPENQKKMYAERAKKVNRTLLSYDWGYISVYGGNINDAVEVFSRLNSKSTPISADYMIQALAYNPDSRFLFANEISDIKNQLWEYNFNQIKRELLLDCAYIYADIPFIDGKAEDLLRMKNDLPVVMQGVADDVVKSVQFLYNHCGVIDYKLLPYSYQLIMLASFFRWNKQMSDAQSKELKRWFFYTTYSSYFTNTSLSVIRKDIHRFTDYAKGKVNTPIEYDKNMIDFKLPDTLNLGGVRACAFVATFILQNQLQQKGTTLNLYALPHTGSKNIGNTFVCTSKQDVEEISSWLRNPSYYTDRLSHFGLTKKLAELYKGEDKDEFISQRTLFLADWEKQFVSDILSGIK